ncbi:MAG: urease accessory protein UreF [Clostridiales Family XIII bacterium]|jgi:urease accessory protein|nr:urease accessory protein UreF [Clostridiales Family XIII bacterium]
MKADGAGRGFGHPGICSLLQFAGGTFPTGAFSHSFGFETYVYENAVCDLAEFQAFADSYLRSVLGGTEAPFVAAVCRHAVDGNTERIRECNELLTAMRLTKESREASIKTGKAFLRVAAALFPDAPEMKCLLELQDCPGVNYATAFGVTLTLAGLDAADVVSAYVFSGLSSLIQCGVKLIPLGNTEAQFLLFRMQDQVTDVCAAALLTDLSDVCNFTPCLDIASVKHEDLPSRLYIS